MVTVAPPSVRVMPCMSIFELMMPDSKIRSVATGLRGKTSCGFFSSRSARSKILAPVPLAL